MKRTVDPEGEDRGFVTLTFVGTVGLTLVLLVMFTNLLAVHYARGVMQSAVEEGARQGLAVGTRDACQRRARAVIDTGLGAMAEGMAPVSCAVDIKGATASLTGTFTPWLPLLPAQVAAVQARVRAGTPP